VDRIRILCPAKVNLHLRVLCRRPDGYHEIVSLMQAVDLSDELLLNIGGDGIRVQCDHPELPADEGNLAWRAARLYQEETGDRFGVEIRLRKRIPVAAGLGGGSSDAAGVLRGLNEMRGGGVPQDRLALWAGRLGADVPFFLQGRPALATGIGEKLAPVRILIPLFYVLVFPGWPISTRWVYESLDLGLTIPPKKSNIPHLIERVEEIAELLHNDLESVTARTHPWISRTKTRLREMGALGALMSGSGPAVFGIFSEAAAARETHAGLGPQAGESVWWARGVT
jgi:4-diphosphocytidyl-2-C-methyl-D-erythritol kinase